MAVIIADHARTPDHPEQRQLIAVRRWNVLHPRRTVPCNDRPAEMKTFFYSYECWTSKDSA
jgi:hypothetical protein